MALKLFGFVDKFSKISQHARLIGVVNVRLATFTTQDETLRPPKRALTAYQAYMSHGLKQHHQKSPDLNKREYFKVLSSGWKDLDANKRQEYEKVAEVSKQAYRSDLKKFQESLTTEQTEELMRQKASHTNMLKEKRKKEEMRMLKRPKNAVSAYCFFIKDRFHSHDNVDSKELVTKLSKEWRHSSDKEKAVYVDAAVADKVRYYKEMREWEDEMIESGHKDLVRARTSNKIFGPPKTRKSSKNTKIFRVSEE